MPSKKEMQAEIDNLSNALRMTNIEGREIIGELKQDVKTLEDRKHVLEGKYDRLQNTVVELNKRNNRLRDHIVRSIENA